MATSPLLGGERAATQPSGRDVESLGPSDRSDSGSDVQGELDLYPDSDLDNHLATTPGGASDSDSGGTGERGAALPESDVREGDDIFPDQVQGASEDDADSASAQTDLVDAALIEDLADESDSDEGREDEDLE
jgi:hypothetical protein